LWLCAEREGTAATRVTETLLALDNKDLELGDLCREKSDALLGMFLSGREEIRIAKLLIQSKRLGAEFSINQEAGIFRIRALE
jgi:hypothetical protein